MRRIGLLLLGGIFLIPVTTHGQVPTPGADVRSEYDERFFQALRTIFDTFRNADLQRVLQSATPIGCSELLGGWRTAAFFSEDPNLERWFYKTFEEVQADLSQYVFRGGCKTESGDLDVVSRFPVRESMEAYNKKQIEFDRVAFKANAPVKARFDSRTRAYQFELPYLYVTGRSGDNSTYSMMPPNAAAKYAAEVATRWECKSVKNTEITYRFLLCRTTIVPRNARLRNPDGDTARGRSAYILLTDGREARATITLSFPTDTSPDSKNAANMSRIAELSRESFFLRFVKRSWESRIASTTILADGQFVVAEPAVAPMGDYCEWRPLTPATAALVDESDNTIQYYLTRSDRNEGSPASFLFDARTAANVRLGVLRCAFPGTDSALGLEMKRLLTIFGDHVRIEFN